ncbi:hypothetical protein V2S85_23510 [Novosphingobium resinovorum]|nr:hypothetical protein [Novosphingobium resinovorum]
MPILDFAPAGGSLPFLSGGGACAELIASRDWSATPLGPIAQWPHCLTGALSILLRSRVPMVMMWGPAGVMLYNDAYSNFAGGRHPGSLGSDVRESWPEIAAFNDAIIKAGLAGETPHFRDQEMTLLRNGTPEVIAHGVGRKVLRGGRLADSPYGCRHRRFMF